MDAQTVIAVCAIFSVVVGIVGLGKRRQTHGFAELAKGGDEQSPAGKKKPR